MSEGTVHNLSVETDTRESNDYFEKNIPLWSNDSSGQRFAVLNDPQNGRIPVSRVEHWKDFISILEDSFFSPLGSELIYRGHRCSDWMLTPTLGRLAENNIVTREMAGRQLDRFRKSIRGRVSDRSLLEDGRNQEDELWAIGQHHGLRTPLLDWTHSPYVSLFFAFEHPDTKEDAPNHEENRGNLYRAVYVLDKTFVGDDEECPDIRLLEPRKDDHGRLVNQAGLFTFSPEDATIENKIADVFAEMALNDNELSEADEESEAKILARYICKIYIKNIDREGCLKHLRQMNVHHASLFPDLIGASQYCNLIIEEEEVFNQELFGAARKLDKLVNKTLPEAFGKDKESTAGTLEPYFEKERGGSVEDILASYVKIEERADGWLGTLSDEMLDSLRSEMVVDWKERDSVLARMRLVAKNVLRKYNYPVELREQVAGELVDSLAGQKKEEASDV